MLWCCQATAQQLPWRRFCCYTRVELVLRIDALIEALAPGSVQTVYVERNDNVLSTDVVMVNPLDKAATARLKLSKLHDGQEEMEQWVTLPPFGMQICEP